MGLNIPNSFLIYNVVPWGTFFQLHKNIPLCALKVIFHNESKINVFPRSKLLLKPILIHCVLWYSFHKNVFLPAKGFFLLLRSDGLLTMWSLLWESQCLERESSCWNRPLWVKINLCRVFVEQISFPTNCMARSPQRNPLHRNGVVDACLQLCGDTYQNFMTVHLSLQPIIWYTII